MYLLWKGVMLTNLQSTHKWWAFTHRRWAPKTIFRVDPALKGQAIMGEVPQQEPCRTRDRVNHNKTDDATHRDKINTHIQHAYNKYVTYLLIE
jgi:hypothetical protein